MNIKNLTPTRYQLDYFRNDETGEVIIDVTLNRFGHRDGSFWWSITERGCFLTRGGRWTNSSRSMRLHCTFESAEAAAVVWIERKCTSRAEQQLRLELKHEATERREWLESLLANIDARSRWEFVDDGRDGETKTGNKMTGIELIVAERARQLNRKGYTHGHDDTHVSGEIACAAAVYATPPLQRVKTKIAEMIWPRGWKRKDSVRIRELTVAGALIAAEIDRLQRRA